MAFMSCIGPCMRCHVVFAFNPERVPSLVVNGEREPVCLACITEVNPLRIAKGLPPIEPLPGAYEPEEVP